MIHRSTCLGFTASAGAAAAKTNFLMSHEFLLGSLCEHSQMLHQCRSFTCINNSGSPSRFYHEVGNVYMKVWLHVLTSLNQHWEIIWILLLMSCWLVNEATESLMRTVSDEGSEESRRWLASLSLSLGPLDVPAVTVSGARSVRGSFEPPAR